MIKDLLNNILVYVLIVAIIIIAVLVFCIYIMKAQRDIAQVNYQQALAANQANIEAIAKLEKEKRAVEMALSKRIKEQARLEELFKKEAEKREKEIEELRRKYETVNDYLDMPVPAELLNWLLQGNSKNRSDKNDTACGFNSATSGTFFAGLAIEQSNYWGSA